MCSRPRRRASIPPAAHDLYSATVEQVIFETLLTYDYLARPAKLVPLTAEALPEITDDGKTYTVKLKKGIHFTPTRRSRAGSASSSPTTTSIREAPDRSEDRSPWAWLVEGKFVGLDELAKRRRRAASSTTTRRSPASKPSTATRCASG